MLLFTIIYDGNREDVISGLNKIQDYFKEKKVHVGISESIEKNTHFVRLYCDDEVYTDKIYNMFKLYMSNIIFQIILKNFSKKEMSNFLSDTYFFLRYEEIDEISKRIMNVLLDKVELIDENSIYYENRKNEIVKKIEGLIEDNREFNLDGFLRFRFKDFKQEILDIVDKVVENYMAEKEYDEFIKLLKYFVEIQDSKIDTVNLYIDKNGDYTIKDNSGKDLKGILFKDLTDLKYSKETNFEDILISGLITSVPEEIIIHCPQNSKNQEFIATLKSVFGDRLSLCDSCSVCINIMKSKNLKKSIDKEHI